MCLLPHFFTFSRLNSIPLKPSSLVSPVTSTLLIYVTFLAFSETQTFQHPKNYALLLQTTFILPSVMETLWFSFILIVAGASWAPLYFLFLFIDDLMDHFRVLSWVSVLSFSIHTYNLKYFLHSKDFSNLMTSYP